MRWYWLLSLFTVSFVLQVQASEDSDINQSDKINEIRFRSDPCNYNKSEHPQPEINKLGRRVSDIKCEEYSWYYWANVIEAEKMAKECIRLAAVEEAPIHGGEITRQADFPHIGAVGWKLPNGDIRFMCGCSLISPKFALTAAHCRKGSKRVFQENDKPYLVRFGDSYLQTTPEFVPAVHDALIAEFHVPAQYSQHPQWKYDDIGLIEFEKDLVILPNIRPACLFTGDPSYARVANVTGWDSTTIEDPKLRSLKYEEVVYVDQSTCKRSINGLRNRNWAEGLKDHQFCAGNSREPSNLCQGNSGGPLQVRKPMPGGRTGEDHLVVGVLSFGITCGYPMLPKIYTSVNNYQCWIERIVWPEEQNSFCPLL